MSTELTLLNLLGSNRELFNRITPHVKPHTFSKEMGVLLAAVSSYYTTVAPSATEVVWDNLLTHFLATTKLKPDDAELYRSIVEKVEEVELSSIDEETTAIINHYIKLDYATRTIDVAMRIVDGDSKVSMEDVLKNVTDYHKEVKDATDEEDVFASTDISAIVDKVATSGWEWRLECLNISLGPLREGDFIILAARPETGKTTMLASELTHFASQMPNTDTRPIVWVNNEEDSNKVQFRVTQAALGVTTGDIMADTARAMDEYNKLMNGVSDRIRVINKSNKYNNVHYLDNLFRELNPAIIVFDQLDKVHGFDKEKRDDLRLGKLYEWARELATRSAVIAVSQVGGSGEGQRWIYQDQLRGSTTDKAGEADAIITVGKVNEASLINNRFIHVPKNKLFGGPRSEEEHRHGFWEVEIVPQLARYK